MRYHSDTNTWSGSATDLVNHAHCDHLTQRSRFAAREIALGMAEAHATNSLLMEKGKEHEANYVASRRAAGVELETQVWLEAGSLRGYADLLERGANGSWEPVEIKYARSVQPEHILQSLMYADALERTDGVRPENVHIVDGKCRRHTYPIDDCFFYYQLARKQFEKALALDLDTELEKVPNKVAHCTQCVFAPICDERRKQADHLSLVAWIRQDQINKLRQARITTLTQLAQSNIVHVKGIGNDSLARLKDQARLQLEARKLEPSDAPIKYRRPKDDESPGRGFALLPAPDPADMFFDFEGYPFHEAGGLEYLWGWTFVDTDGKMRFDYLWASDPNEEKLAFSRFLDLVHERLAIAPNMHIYHYANYEIAALQRLALAHPHEQWRLDVLLRAGVFVDLFAVVRQAMLIGTSSYSIKKLEPLYGVSREGAGLADGGASIEVFERWLMERDDKTKELIISYNRDDTDSTLLLRNWLLEHAKKARSQGIDWPEQTTSAAKDHENKEPISQATTADSASDDEEPPALKVSQRLEEVARDHSRSDIRLVAKLLSGMPGWDWRSRRQFFAQLHASKNEHEVDDYLDDPAALAGLELTNHEIASRGTELRTYSYPHQPTLVSVGQKALDAFTVSEVGEIVDVDPDQHTLTIKTTRSVQNSLDYKGHSVVPRVVVGWDSIPVAHLEKSAKTIGESFLDAVNRGSDIFSADQPFASIYSILARHTTRANDGDGTKSLSTPPDPAQLVDLVRRAAGSHVIVQGPPGTGKTYTSARVIAGLVEAGLRVGISSNAHEAVINLLDGIDRYYDGDVPFKAAYPLRKKEDAPGTLTFGSDWIERSNDNKEAASLADQGKVMLLAGTAWTFASFPNVDVVLIDEAGQVSLLYACVMAGAAKVCTVLVGDPQQLAQPQNAKHPEGLEASVLDHLFAGKATLPPSRAALLNVTRRMHPNITAFIGPTYYDNALTSHPDTQVQKVIATGLPENGIHVELVEHEGCRLENAAEARRIKTLVEHLVKRGRVVEKAGTKERNVRRSDIMVVAPYNAQRRLLTELLGSEVRIGTVDKFQGREAPIAILSLTASSREDVPRGLEFLLDPHRINVAISRARALAIVVCSPSLLRANARSLTEMQMLNDLARLNNQSASRPLQPVLSS